MFIAPARWVWSKGPFDFVVRLDGTWVFLECNAGGQYGWIEDAVSAPITTALADLLAAGNHASATIPA